MSDSSGLGYLAGAMNIVMDEFFACAPETAAKLADMQDKVVEVRIVSMNRRFFFMPAGDSVWVRTEWSGKSDVYIAGSLFDLSRMALTETTVDVNIEIVGNVDLGRRFVAVFTDADVTLGDFIANVAGDAPAALAEHGMARAAYWGKRVADSLSVSAGDFLREETRAVPSPREIKRFITSADELRDACARLEARLNRFADGSRSKP